MDLWKNSGGKLLRCGYTTGACAAAAAQAAARMLLTGQTVSAVTLATPRGPALTLDVLDAAWDGRRARCAVRKDAGDDPDVTAGVLVYAEAVRIPAGVTVDGGEGVGRVTKPGLDQPVGAAAINSTPRRMIEENVAAVCAAAGYTGGVAVTVSIPGGAEIARRTFNPRMGVEGGLSVLGTSGIVEPMSTRALADTVRLELRQLRAEGGDTVLLVPGNYGHDFAENELGLSVERCVSCANFIGEAIDAAVELGFRQILLVGHVGKLVKLGIGVTNTHSSAGDGRMETLAACAALRGAEGDLIRGVLGCATTDAALTLLAQAGRKEEVCALLGSRIDDTLNRRVPPGVEIGCVMFTNRAELGPVLWRSENAERLTKNWRRTI